MAVVPQTKRSVLGWYILEKTRILTTIVRVHVRLNVKAAPSTTIASFRSRSAKWTKFVNIVIWQPRLNHDIMTESPRRSLRKTNVPGYVDEATVRTLGGSCHKVTT